MVYYPLDWCKKHRERTRQTPAPGWICPPRAERRCEMKKLFCALMLPAVLLFTVSCTELPNKIDRTETKAEADADTGHGVINNGGVDTTPGFGELHPIGGN